MPQMQLPIFPEGVTHITSELAFKKTGGRVTYLNGSMPVFAHDADDIRTFRMITSQFCANGNAKQSEMAHAFGITPISVRRGVKLYREQGVRGFYAPRRTRGASVLTPPVLKHAQQLLDDGLSVAGSCRHTRHQTEYACQGSGRRPSSRAQENCHRVAEHDEK